LELKLDRAHDVSAVIHVERFNDGRIMLTAVPLLYGTYTVMRGTGTFSLEPPLALNLDAGWPLFKEQSRLRAEMHYAQFKEGRGQPQAPAQVAVPGLVPGGTPPPPENQLVRVEAAKAVTPPPALPVSPKGKAVKATPTPKGKLAKGKATPKPSASVAASPAAVAQTSPPPQSPPSAPIAQNSPPPPTPAKSPQPAPAQSSPPQIAVAQAVQTRVRAQPAEPGGANDVGTLASTIGGGSWKTFPPGKMPLGRLVATSDLKEIAEKGTAGERIYLKGQFVVNFSDANRAILRPRGKLTDSVLHFGAAPTRIIVEFPAGYTPPTQGSTVNRDEARPLEITEVRRQEDGQLNVFAREIMQ
jgi:hypothetical protein